MKEKQIITVIITSFNEKLQIADAINSVYFADDIIVKGSFSPRNTIILVKKYKVSVIQGAIDNFSSQKDRAIYLAKYDLILKPYFRFITHLFPY